METYEVFLAIDQEGSYLVASDRDDFDTSDLVGAVRIITLKVKASSPKAVEVEVIVPDEAGEVAAVTAE